MAEQFDSIFKRYFWSRYKTLMIQIIQKPLKAFGTKNEEQFDLLVVLLPRIKEALQGHQSYNTRKHSHSYQIIQGDLGIKLLLQNLLKQESVCFDTETTGLDALHAN
jgi:DNA polymerase-1